MPAAVAAVLSAHRLAKHAAMMAGRYAHAKQFQGHRPQLRLLRSRLGRIIDDIRRKIAGRPELEAAIERPLARARVHRQGQGQRALRVNGMDHARSQRQPRAPGASGAQAMSNTHIATIG